MQGKVYYPDTIEQQPFGSNAAYQGNSKVNVIADASFPVPVIASDILSSTLNTQSRMILGNYTFGEMGAIAIGKYINGTSGDVRISPTGILARNSSGLTTFSLNAVTGNVTVSGYLLVGGAEADITTISGAKITTGTITADKIQAGTITSTQLSATAINGMTITGATIQTASSGARVVMNNTNLTSYDSGNNKLVQIDGSGIDLFGENSLAFYTGTTVVGMIFAYNSDYLYIATAVSGGDRIVMYGDTGISFDKSSGDFLFNSSELRFSSTKYLQVSENLRCDSSSLAFGDTKRLRIGDREMHIKNDAKFAIGNGHIYIDNNGGGYQDKAAILETSQGYRSVLCPESPEVWFFDFYNPEVESIDPLFLEITEGDSHEIKCSDGYVQIWRRRKGYAHKRFESKTQEQYEKSISFWTNLNK